MVEMNLSPVLYTHAVLQAGKYRDEMMRLSAAATVQSVICSAELVKVLKAGMELNEDGATDVFDFYGSERDHIRREYEERDRRTVDFIKKNPEIKAYVERISGTKCEDIWSNIW